MCAHRLDSATLQHNFNWFWRSKKIFIILRCCFFEWKNNFFYILMFALRKIGNNNYKIIFMAERVRDVLINLFSNLNSLLKSMKKFFFSHSLELQCFPSTIRTPKFILRMCGMGGNFCCRGFNNYYFHFFFQEHSIHFVYLSTL